MATFKSVRKCPSGHFSLHLITFSATCLLLLLLQHAAAQDDGASTPDLKQVSRARSSLKLTLDNFRQFTRQFSKTYESLMEELRRKKLFMARAMRAFVSAAGYKFGNRSSYLSVNAMSDWTREEFAQTVISEDRFEQDLSTAVDGDGQHPNWVALISRSQAMDEDEDSEETPEDGVNTSDLSNPTQLPSESLMSQAPQYVKFVGGLMANAFSGYKYEDRGNRSAGDQVFIDHSRSDCVQSPRSQGRCGSCYVFSAIALYEWFYCNATGATDPTFAFSEQYLTDCGGLVPAMNGCEGGIVYQVSEFVNKYGLELQRHYPYLARRDECPYSKSMATRSRGSAEMGQVRVKDQGFGFVPIKDFAKSLAKSPLLIIVETGDNFQEYGGGVDSPKNCGKHGKHSALLVGHGREDGQEYWLIKNSYGLDWGQWGYYKLSKKSNSCIQPGVGARLEKFEVLERAGDRQVSRQVVERFV